MACRRRQNARLEIPVVRVGSGRTVPCIAFERFRDACMFRTPALSVEPVAAAVALEGAPGNMRQFEVLSCDRWWSLLGAVKRVRG